MFVAGDQDSAKAQIAADPRFATLMQKWQADMPERSTNATTLATDDWPYIYLEHRQIPPLYFLLALALGILFWLGLREIKAPQIIRGWEGSQTHFFLLVAAFMLLEVQNISKAAVVLGNTWIVNAVIISGILIMILLANAIAGRIKKLPDGLMYAALGGQLHRPLLPRSLAVRFPSLLAEGSRRRLAHQPADALQWHRLHPLVRRRRAKRRRLRCQLVRFPRRRFVANRYLRHRHKGTPLDRRRVVPTRRNSQAPSQKVTP